MEISSEEGFKMFSGIKERAKMKSAKDVEKMRKRLGIEKCDQDVIKQIKTFLDLNKILDRTTNQRNEKDHREKYNTIRDTLNFYVNIAHLKYQKKLNNKMVSLTIAIFVLTLAVLILTAMNYFFR
ncbi:MAG: hypothetical protein KKD75_02165 [Nanoarchaeota archaeon]|nr:hypothetical protein [Nanoarchaeota archaeon]MBU1876436.1 hypothetical protein [Nanoarchaeota archaeon]